MEELRALSCPVCGDPASEEMHLHDEDAQTISCPKCGRFGISATALRIMGLLAPEERRGKLEDARKQAQPGQIPLIVST